MKTESPSYDFQLGQEDMRERVCAILKHYADVAKTFHGKGSDQHLTYINLIHDVRQDQYDELEKEKP
jgi:hypothetical protein